VDRFNLNTPSCHALLHHPTHPPTCPGPLARGLVACTGAQFCGVGLVETKTRAIELMERLEAAYDIPQTVRVHFSGCPNSCGQSQVADIGLMGAPAKKDGKAVEGVDIFLGGAVGEGEWGAGAGAVWCSPVTGWLIKLKRMHCGPLTDLACPSPPPFPPPQHTQTKTTEAALGDKVFKNVPMGENDADLLASLGEILVGRFGAVKK
jgi:hypothetical protein